MKVVARKLAVDNAGVLQELVVDSIDGIEQDLRVLDSRLLLGNAHIDIVAIDGAASLVLIAVGLTADETMLLKAVEAYSWCLEYPESVRRLYPGAEISEARPPRLMFVVERMPDAFHRKIKQLGFPEVDCVEFRHLSVDGTEAVYFDTIVRLRRTAVTPNTPAQAAVAATLSPQPAPEPVAPAPSVAMAAPLGAINGARATSVKLQKLMNADAPSAPHTIETVAAPVTAPAPVIATPAPAVAAPAPAIAAPASVPVIPPAPMIAPVREPAAVVSMVNRSVRIAAATRIDDIAPIASRPALQPVVAAIAAKPVIEPPAHLTLREAVAPVVKPVPAPEPTIDLRIAEPIVAVPASNVVEAAASTVEPAEPRLSFSDLSRELLGGKAAVPVAPAATPAPARASVAPAVDAPNVDEITRSLLAQLDAATKGTAVSQAPVDIAPAFELPEIEAEPAPVREIAPVAPVVPEPVAVAPEPVLVAPQPEAASEPVVPAAPEVPDGLPGLKFPGDGQLTRQWMEFLNQMAASK